MSGNTINNLNNIAEVQPFGNETNDVACFNELRDVLAKHNKLDRFGLCLLHKHFDVKPDEILVESCDILNRTLTIRPEKVTPKPGQKNGLMDTNWRFFDNSSHETFAAVQVCRENTHSD